LASHGNVPAKVSLLVAKINGITTEAQLVLWFTASASGAYFSHFLKIFSLPMFAF